MSEIIIYTLCIIGGGIFGAGLMFALIVRGLRNIGPRF